MLDYVFRFLPPNDLLACMLVSREFCAYARTNAVWERHKRRVLEEIPALSFVFLEKEDTWRCYQKYLMGNIVQKALAFQRLHLDVILCYIRCVFVGDETIRVRVWSANGYNVIVARVFYRIINIFGDVKRKHLTFYVGLTEQNRLPNGYGLPDLCWSFKSLIYDRAGSKDVCALWKKNLLALFDAIKFF